MNRNIPAALVAAAFLLPGCAGSQDSTVTTKVPTGAPTTALSSRESAIAVASTPKDNGAREAGNGERTFEPKISECVGTSLVIGAFHDGNYAVIPGTETANCYDGNPKLSREEEAINIVLRAQALSVARNLDPDTGR